MIDEFKVGAISNDKVGYNVTGTAGDDEASTTRATNMAFFGKPFYGPMPEGGIGNVLNGSISAPLS